MWRGRNPEFHGCVVVGDPEGPTWWSPDGVSGSVGGHGGRKGWDAGGENVVEGKGVGRVCRVQLKEVVMDAVSPRLIVDSMSVGG